MRTVVIQGGWRLWTLLIVGGAVALVLALTVGVLLLGVFAVAAVLFLGQRLMQAIGLGSRPRVTHGTTEPADGVIDGDFQVVSRETTVIRELPAPRE